jgi:O-6-methylguanine DNA methyltransferase
MKSFKEKVLKVVKNIPKGKTMSYAEVAQKAGSPQASRAVGSIMAANSYVSR